MGYYTGYSLNISGPGSVHIIYEVRAKYENARYAFDENGEQYATCKWYDHEDDMKAFSRLYPDVLFTLNGIGEDYPDIWVKYFKNGKMQFVKAKIVLDPFDESKLK